MIPRASDDSVINLRKPEVVEPEFKIEPAYESIPEVDMVSEALKSGDKVKIKFDKFVNLVATHAYEEIVDKHMDDEIIISTDLLADLANAHEDGGEKKVSLMFVAGILIGVLIAWFLIKY